MSGVRIVLDTNAFRGLPTKEVARLASMGFTFVVSETALSETLAASVRDFERGVPRDRARGLLFKRAKLFGRHVDEQDPIAPAGGIAIERIRAAVSGRAPNAEAMNHVDYLRRLWHVLVGIEPLDEEWIAAGHEAEAWLANIDRELHSLARREAELWGKVEEPVEEKRQQWFALSEAEQLEQIRAYLRTTWDLDDETADRLDAHTCFLSLRLHKAAYGREMTKENDAPDLRFLVHLGEGLLLLSGDGSFVRLVDESGTHQAPWVRRLRDLEDALPAGPPWGTSAREEARDFRRGP